MSKTLTLALAGLGTLALLVLQFLPWAHDESSFSAFGSTGTVDITATTWGIRTDSSGSGFGFSGSSSEGAGWYDSDADDSEGVGLVRTSIPLLLAGTIAAAIATILGFVGTARVTGIVALVATVLAVTGTALFATGVNQFFQDTAPTWLAGFYVAITACVLLLGSTVVGLANANRSGTASTA